MTECKHSYFAAGFCGDCHGAAGKIVGMQQEELQRLRLTKKEQSLLRWVSQKLYLDNFENTSNEIDALVEKLTPHGKD